MKKFALKALVSSAALVIASPSLAATLAIFGQNNIGDLYTSGGNSVTYVSDADLATAGFLNAYDAFVYTRDGSSFGQGLSVAAAANVKSFVTGNIIIFNGDFQDDIGDATTNLLFNNALAYVLGGAGKGYIGEYRGAFAAYSSNADGNNPIGLIEGSSGISGGGQGGSDGDINITAAGLASTVTSGVPFPYNPAAVEFGAQLSGENPAKVLARFSNGNAAIIAGEVGQISNPGAVPEPATWAMMIGGFGMVGGSMRYRRRKTTVTFA